MKLNIFKIDSDQVELLRARLDDADMTVIKEVEQAGWAGQFYFSDKPHPSSIPWA